MKDVRRFDSGTPWESNIKYSRAIRRGPYVAVSGTTAMHGDQLVATGDAGGQADYIFEKISLALAEVGASLGDVIRTRMYVSHHKYGAAVTAAHARAMANVLPATSLLVVNGFISPELLVEIEVDAVIV